MEFVASRRARAVAVAFGPDGYIWRWAQATFENWQSEFLQVFVFIVLTTFLVHRTATSRPTPTTTPRPPSAGSRPSSTTSSADSRNDERARHHARDVRDEHRREVDERAHWAYLFAVLVIGGLYGGPSALLDALG